MIEELQLINHWLISKDPYFFRKHGVDRSYFLMMDNVVGWIEKFRDDTYGNLPTIDTVAVEFEDFRKLSDLDPVPYLVGELREQKAYREYRPVLIANAGNLDNGGNTIEQMWKLRNDVDNLLKQYATKPTHHDWVKNAKDRYDKYMEKHGQDGLAGLPTGIKKLDELTGGWKDDDLILLAGRLNEGKSLIGGYFGFHAWLHLQAAGMTDPVIYISTEMPELEVAYRLDAMKAHFSNRALMEGRLPMHELYLEYLEELSSRQTSFLIMTQEANRGNAFTPMDIRAIIESERPAFIVIDQLYDLSDGTGERDIRRRIVNVSNGIRDVNLYTRTPIMLLTQAGREAAKEARKNNSAAPELDQIQESDNPAQKATRAITIRRFDNTFKLSLKKNRGGEKDKDVYLRADIDQGNWEEIDETELYF